MSLSQNPNNGISFPLSFSFSLVSIEIFFVIVDFVFPLSRRQPTQKLQFSINFFGLYRALRIIKSDRHRRGEVVRMAPEEEKMTRRSPLDFPISKPANRIATLEFDHDRKSMGVIVSFSFGESLVVKGVVENLLERSSFVQLLNGSTIELDQGMKDAIIDSLDEMSTSALRCLGFTYKDDLSDFETYNGDEDHAAHQLMLNPSNYPSIESKLSLLTWLE